MVNVQSLLENTDYKIGEIQRSWAMATSFTSAESLEKSMELVQHSIEKSEG